MFGKIEIISCYKLYLFMRVIVSIINFPTKKVVEIGPETSTVSLTN